MIENDSKPTPASSKLLRLRQSKTDINLEFKPLVQVDPSVLQSTLMPLKNPRVGDYQLKQTASTEGIASKKSLELKKRYLLGENVLATGIMKSDTTSMLDSKLKNFHTTISGCQKLLNMASDISPALQTFLKNTIASDGDSVTAQTEGSPEISIVNIENYEEKENVYKHIVKTKNELNKPETSEACKRRKSENAEFSIDLTNNEKELPQNAVETIDLVTPEKNTQLFSSTKDTVNFPHDVSKNTNQITQIINSTDAIHNMDLTGDAPLNRSANTKDHDSVGSDSVPQFDDETRALSGPFFEHCTSANDVGASICRILKEEGSNSSKSSVHTSSSSSPAGIPHQILDSTNTSTDVTPIEPKELMQMDSLMIIDGKYTGDPEDLIHMQMPETTDNEQKSNVRKSLATEIATESINVCRYETIYKRPELKFDTRNENKIDSLRNLPMILPKQIARAPGKDTKFIILNMDRRKDENNSSENDKTPTSVNPSNIGSQEETTIEESTNKSDSETETTGCICTETELSDWTADDAVSETFVDIEFALNSSNGMLTRNRRGKNKTSRIIAVKRNSDVEKKTQGPTATCLDFDGIDFMDTGSEDSCMETYAATNDAMLKNRGYVKFVNATNPHAKTNYCGYEISSEKKNERNHDEEGYIGHIGSVEFIEQGSCVIDQNKYLKTVKIPAHSTKAISESVKNILSEVEDESLMLNLSQGGGNTTTEESEALTIVSSPIDSTPQITGRGKIESPKQLQTKCSELTDSDLIGNKDSGDLTYGDYVRQLQIAITQISNARDSIDVRKMKRKHSKGELCSKEPSKLVQGGQQQQHNLQQSPCIITDKHNKNSNKILSIYVSSETAPVITVNEKLEEITKERTKQKDLIHDLVMNKLQNKKQLNAEKRLSRSRNRSSALSLSPVTNALPPPPPNPIAKADSANSEDNRIISSAVIDKSNCDYDSQRIYKNDDFDPRKVFRCNQRPLSDSVDKYFEFNKINKMKSHCAYDKKSGESPDIQNESSIQPRLTSTAEDFNTPLLAVRKNTSDVLCQSADELLQHTKLRVHLISSQEFGLISDETNLFLRKSHNLENATNMTQPFSDQNATNFTQPLNQPNKSDDMKVRERKMIASKSVNDIAATNLVLECDNSSASKHTTYDLTPYSNLHNEKPLKHRQKESERRKSIIQAVSEFFHKKKDRDQPVSPKEKNESMFGIFRNSPKTRSKVFFHILFRNFLLFSYTQKTCDSK